MEIITRRFLLRDFTEAERPAFIAYHADSRYLALSGPDGEDPQHSQSLFQMFRDWTSERPRRNYQLAVLQRQEPQALVGCCGLRGAGCELGKAELGIELAPAYWARHGYAIEVGRALLEFGFSDLGLQEIYGVTVDANAQIARLAEWFGGRGGCHTFGGGVDVRSRMERDGVADHSRPVAAHGRITFTFEWTAGLAYARRGRSTWRYTDRRYDHHDDPGARAWDADSPGIAAREVSAR